jgi:negative regulator of replication initiation
LLAFSLLTAFCSPLRITSWREQQVRQALRALQQVLHRQAFAQQLRVLGRVLLLLLFCHKHGCEDRLLHLVFLRDKK